MALLLAKRQQRFPSNPYLIRFFSNSSSDSPPKDVNASSIENPSQSPSSPSDSSYSSPLADIKTTLKQRLQKQQEQGRKPFTRSDSPSQNQGSSRFSDNQPRGSLQDLGKNLANFPPTRDSGNVLPSHSPPQISFEALYKQNAVPNSSAPRNRKPHDFNSKNVFENLKNLKSQSNTPYNMDKTGLSLRSFKDSLKTISEENVGSNVFEGQVNGRKGKGGETEKVVTEFLTFYSEEELGEKLKMLRPEGKKEEGWFSLHELNQRLVKLRQVEEKEAQSRRRNFAVLTNVIATFKDDEVKNEEQNFDIMGMSNWGLTPEYMLHPPKGDLFETYFHPDNLSSAEKMKSELTKVREEFKMSESDCGSARVQVAQLTTKIKHLASALHKKDKHSRKGLLGMVQKRKKLLKYLRRTDWDSYCLVLSKLSLRDNPDYKF